MYLLVFLSVLCTHTSFYIMVAEKPKIQYFLLGLGLSFGLSSVFFSYFEYTIPVVNIMCITFVMYIQKRKIVFSLIMAIMASMVALVSDYLLSNVLVIITSGHIEDMLYGNGYTGAYIYTLGVIAVACIVSFIDGYMLNKRIGVTEILFSGKIATMTLILMVVSVVFFFGTTAFCKRLGFNNQFIQSMGLMIGAYFLVTVTISFQMLRNMSVEVEYRNQVEQNKNLNVYVMELERVYRELKIFRHDYKNILSSLYIFIMTNNMDGLKTYFETEIIKADAQSDSRMNKMDFLQKLCNKEISGVIMAKALRAKENEVEFSVNVPDFIDEVKMDIIDLIRLIGILLDNAIEENIGIENGYVILEILCDDGEVVVSVVNKARHKIENINAIFASGFSTKKGNTGLGLGTVQSIVAKYDNVNFVVDSDENEFLAQIEIK